MDLKINKEDIQEYINNSDTCNKDEILDELYSIYGVDKDNKSSRLYVINQLVSSMINNKKVMDNIYNTRREKLKKLKELKLPEQRSQEWYNMRKQRLTASSLASALNKDHFTSRSELILSKLEEKPYETNPITEWGVKYEDVAIMFYEELNNVKVLDFGLVPHPYFDAFGASPDGICDDTGNLDYIGRMVEIKCPPKRKFTKTVPEHYKMQVLGQLEVCNLDECDFFQVKIEEYNDYEEYSKDNFINESTLRNSWGRTALNFPKGCTLTYIKSNEDKMSYLYPKFNLSDSMYSIWLQENKDKIEKEGHKFVEAKYWKITRYECTLLQRNKEWWNNIIPSILSFYEELLYYKQDNNIEILKDKVKNILSNKKKKTKAITLQEHQLVSDEEDN